MDKDTLTDQNLCPRIIPHQATLEPKLSLRQIYSGFTAAAYCLLKSRGVNFSLSKNLRQQQFAKKCNATMVCPMSKILRVEVTK